jgi:NADH:ubiquinone oxidoreductase subunit 5 (subunit L)/multisubunit Na+/H+ antiporter MnhA subunit
LFTHAFFKALLFLGAGSVMHAMGNVIDMRRFSGLRKVLPYTHYTFLCGALTLAGFPLLSGFWSKDEILHSTLEASEVSGGYHLVYLVLFGVALVTAGLTAFYTFRAYFMTFWGELVVPAEASQHGHGNHGHESQHHQGHHAGEQGQAHESPAVMTMPLVILAICAVGIGAAVGPFSDNSFAHFLQETLAGPHYGFGEMEHKLNWLLMGVSAAVALGGIGLAYYLYVLQPALPRKLAQSWQSLYQLSLNKFYVDELYDAIIIKPLTALARLAKVADQYVIDSTVDLIGQSPRLLGGVFQPVQNGLVQYYALTMMVGLIVFLIALIRAL